MTATAIAVVGTLTVANDELVLRCADAIPELFRRPGLRK
jgi:hypothetical protein